MPPTPLALKLKFHLSPALAPSRAGALQITTERKYFIMKFKRAGAAFLAAALTASSMGVYAFAEEDAAMKKALTYVKERLDIPEDLTEFNYRTSTENQSTRYRFTWSKEDENGGSTINVAITGSVIKNVNIYSYSNYENNDWSASFAKLSDKKLLSACKKYIKQLNPSIYKNVEIDEDSFDISLWGNTATLGFHRTANGIPVTGQNGHVTVNKDTGELMNYYFNWINGATFSDTKDVISVKDAQKAYKNLFPVELVYTLGYDWEKGEYQPHLIYRQTSSGQINAFTGKLSTFDDYRSYDGDGDDDYAIETETADEDANPGTGGGVDNGKNVSFSAEEIKKLEDESKLIKADKALKDLQELGIFNIPKQSQISSQNCYFNEQLGHYMRNVSFTGQSSAYNDLNGDGIGVATVNGYEEFYDVFGSFSINAETGELYYFYCWQQDNNSSLDEEETAKKAEKVAETMLGDKFEKDFGKLENTDTGRRWTKYDPNTGKGIGDPIITSKTYSANREANGIVCVNENISFTIGNTGYVTNYNLNYHDNIEYPAPDNIITKNKAYSKFFGQVELGLKHRCAYRTDTKKIVTALVYAADRDLMIDAFSGKLTNYDGSVITEAEKTGTYTDLKDSKYAKYAEKLASYGIVLMDNNGKLSENEAVTFGDLCKVLSFMNVNTRLDADLKETDKINRRTAARLLVTAKYGKDIAELTDLFKVKFSDVQSNDPDIGYIAISDALGLITGSKDKFSPDTALTRGETLKLAYNCLSK